MVYINEIGLPDYGMPLSRALVITNWFALLPKCADPGLSLPAHPLQPMHDVSVEAPPETELCCLQWVYADIFVGVAWCNRQGSSNPILRPPLEISV